MSERLIEKGLLRSTVFDYNRRIMAKAELKTKQTEASVEEFINSVENDVRREDARRLLEIFSRVTGENAKMWGPAIIGFGNVKLKYASGRELEWMKVGFSPRKSNLSLYVSCDISKHGDLLEKLGKHKTGSSCLYIKTLADVDEKVLERLVKESMATAGKA